ncbi:MAG TPA: urea ABC transporter ATP-binding protein UrtD [Chthoniobacteraceae bacterium]|jgi:urea transport system ATP-binding protein|nr:urea ABC transporter ATP-binding protein UrtD [Chthoniobacteraceae bacterium]
MAPDYILSIDKLTVSFDGFKAVDDLNLNLDRNELRVIIGPNGAGKTTVLDLICGKTRATGGSVRFKGHEMLGKAEHKIVRAGIGRKFQTPSIYENLTVFENLEISFPRGRGVFGCLTFQRSEDVVERIKKVAEEVYLADELYMGGAYLSHGQKQWLEIGMLLMQDPELLMLDEPVAGMSPSERHRTAELLAEVAKGRSLLIIEHDMEFVAKIAHRVTVMHLGKVLAEGSMEDIQANTKVQDVYLGH